MKLLKNCTGVDKLLPTLENDFLLWILDLIMNNRYNPLLFMTAAID